MKRDLSDEYSETRYIHLIQSLYATRIQSILLMLMVSLGDIMLLIVILTIINSSDLSKKDTEFHGVSYIGRYGPSIIP